MNNSHCLFKITIQIPEDNPLDKRKTGLIVEEGVICLAYARTCHSHSNLDENAQHRAKMDWKYLLRKELAVKLIMY